MATGVFGPRPRRCRTLCVTTWKHAVCKLDPVFSPRNYEGCNIAAVVVVIIISRCGRLRWRMPTRGYTRIQSKKLPNCLPTRAGAVTRLCIVVWRLAPAQPTPGIHQLAIDRFRMPLAQVRKNPTLVCTLKCIGLLHPYVCLRTRHLGQKKLVVCLILRRVRLFWALPVYRVNKAFGQNL